jgi:glyoxalase superfamily protein
MDRARGSELSLYLLANRPAIADLGSTKVRRSYERHWILVVSDIDATISRLIALGGSLDREVTTREYGRIANMLDPFGNGFEFSARAMMAFRGLERPPPSHQSRAT